MMLLSPTCARLKPGLITVTFLIILVLTTKFSNVDGFATPSHSAPRTKRACWSWSNSASTNLFVGRGIDETDPRGAVPIKPNDDGRYERVLSQEKDLDDAASASLDRAKNDEIHPSALWETLIGNGPPLDVDDANLLLYDAFLIMNLSASISFFVVHRLDLIYVPLSLNEGALLSMCWIVAGLANGAFLSSAVDGHYDPAGAEYAEKGGPRAAGLLALSTFVTTSSLRILIALVAAVANHRQVGVVGSGEELIPLEILFGLVLMSAWRTLHSANTPRI
mmetsp:Transcript_15214/g.36517  ORF Transcript_15214/g.36517 Transcript_15214/m.36517 type:complete len:278 (+) Transcript_15214:164-997(+)